MANYIYTASELIKVAKSQVGYLEKATLKDLDDFTANAGQGNYTKYARDFKEFAKVNNQGYAWCAMFTNWCFVQAFGVDKAKEMLGGFSGYTPTSAGYFKVHNRWYQTPEVGDVIFFKNNVRIYHTGIVAKVENGKIYTIEGNTSDGAEVIPNGGAVCEKSYSVTNSRIAGYGRPPYDKENETIITPTPTTAILKPQNPATIHIVKSGDTLSEIAEMYNTTVDKLVKINNIKKANSIKIGQKIRLK